MIPIGQASTAGNLTFKSTATIVAKEGISMGAGAGAQKITTDVTGNGEKQCGIKIDRRKIDMNTVKAYGSYAFDVKLYPGIVGKINLIVAEK